MNCPPPPPHLDLDLSSLYYLKYAVALVRAPVADGTYTTGILQRPFPMPLARYEPSDVGRTVAVTSYPLAVRFVL